MFYAIEIQTYMRILVLFGHHNVVVFYLLSFIISLSWSTCDRIGYCSLLCDIDGECERERDKVTMTMSFESEKDREN